MGASFAITGDESADSLLATNALALLIGMLLDQQVPMEWAFRGPSTIRQRLGHLDASRIAQMSAEEFVAVCCEPPAIHRFPAAMGRRIHSMCQQITEYHGGDAARVWTDANDASDLYTRLRRLKGFGDEKAKIFIALLAKRFDVRLDGWEATAAPFSDEVPRSAADVDGPEGLAEVRNWKRAQRASGKTKQD